MYLCSIHEDGGPFPLVASCSDRDGVSGGIAVVDAFVLLWVWVVDPYVKDAATELMGMLVIAGLSGTSTNQDRQSAAFLCTGYPLKDDVVCG